MSNITIIIPSYNDASGLRQSLPPLINKAKENAWEIIVVNDCSTDDTVAALQEFDSAVTVITNEVNMGYGASIKRGILAAKTEWVASMDADGQHRIADLEAMAARLEDDDVDALIGKRDKSSHVPFVRMPGKWVLAHAANFITGRKIPDINCGLRILRRRFMLSLLSLTSDGFSFSTSTLVCLLQLGCRVQFVPVTVDERIGKSTVKQVRDGFYTLMLILRLITLFKPLRVFLPLSLILFAATFINQMYVFATQGLDITTATVVGGLFIFCMALLADQISGLRRDLLLRDIKMEQLSCK